MYKNVDFNGNYFLLPNNIFKEKMKPRKTHRSSVRRADNNQFTIPAVVHLAGTFAEMIDYAQRKKKEEDEESSYVQSM